MNTHSLTRVIAMVIVTITS